MMTHARLRATAFLLIDAITALRHGWPRAPTAAGGLTLPRCLISKETTALRSTTALGKGVMLIG